MDACLWAYLYSLIMHSCFLWSTKCYIYDYSIVIFQKMIMIWFLNITKWIVHVPFYTIITHRIHIWNIYLHESQKNHSWIAKYTYNRPMNQILWASIKWLRLVSVYPIIYKVSKTFQVVIAGFLHSTDSIQHTIRRLLLSGNPWKLPYICCLFDPPKMGHHWSTFL